MYLCTNLIWKSNTGALDQMQYQGIKVMWIKMYKNMSAKDETFPSRLSWGSVWERVREKRDFRSLSAPPAPTSLSTPPRLSRWKETQVAKRKETLETLETFPNGRSHKETTCKARRDIRGKNKQRNWEWKAASDRLRRRMGDWQEGQYLLRAACCHNIVIFENYLNISNISNIWELPHNISKEDNICSELSTATILYWELWKCTFCLAYRRLNAGEEK